MFIITLGFYTSQLSQCCAGRSTKDDKKELQTELLGNMEMSLAPSLAMTYDPHTLTA